jgi:hypothetical protein
MIFVMIFVLFRADILSMYHDCYMQNSVGSYVFGQLIARPPPSVVIDTFCFFGVGPHRDIDTDKTSLVLMISCHKKYMYSDVFGES